MNRTILFLLSFISTNLNAADYRMNKKADQRNDVFNTGINIRCACNNEININWTMLPITKQQYGNLCKKIGSPPICRYELNCVNNNDNNKDKSLLFLK